MNLQFDLLVLRPLCMSVDDLPELSLVGQGSNYAHLGFIEEVLQERLHSLYIGCVAHATTMDPIQVGIFNLTSGLILRPLCVWG